MSQVLVPPSADVRRDFKIHSNGAIKAIKRDVDGVSTMFLEGTASSTVRDRHGDTITAKGQAMMLEKAQRLTMWLNHSYNVPEDILGTCEESELVAGKGDDGSDLLDLAIRCKIESTNPRAVKAWQAVENGTQLGFSIGGAITECEVDEENDDGSSWCPPLIIDGIDLYEISLVGIPANPRAYTRDFVQEMSRGFMRNASRNPEVRKHLRNALPALRANATESEPDARVVEAPADVQAEKKLEPGEQSKVALAIGHLSEALAHGACADVEDCVKSAHEVLASLLSPGDDVPDGDEPTVPNDDVQNDAEVTASVDEIARLREEKAQLAKDIEAASARLEKVASEASQRASELQAAEARIAELGTVEKSLQETIERLKATPSGRQTANAQAGGSSHGAGYVRRDQTASEARARLGAKLAGRDVATDPALRPA